MLKDALSLREGQVLFNKEGSWLIYLGPVNPTHFLKENPRREPNRLSTLEGAVPDSFPGVENTQATSRVSEHATPLWGTPQI